MTTPKDTALTIIRGAYDLQKLRIQTGNRLCANFRSKLGLDPNEKPEETPKILTDIRIRYEKITEGVAAITRRRKFDYDGVISDYAELVLVEHYLDLVKREKRTFRELEPILEQFPIWTEFLKGVRGCGHTMAAVIISEIDIHKAKYVSSLWRYAGLDVAKDGKGRSRRAEHLKDVEYTNKKGEKAIRKSITFNPLLKTKLTGVLGPSFLKSGDNKYADIYYNYRHRLENHAEYGLKNIDPETGEPRTSKGHRHNMAIRYMVKMFLKDLYCAWREMEGLPVYPPYSEAKLGMVHTS